MAKTVMLSCNERPIKLTLPVGCALVLALSVLNSLLAILGSVTWAKFPYWPAFMVYAFVCAYFGKWGVILAGFTPFISSAVFKLTDAPFYYYVPVDVVQALLVIATFRYFRISPTLKSNLDKIKYLGLGIAVPSAFGGLLAWALRYFHDEAIGSNVLVYVGLWTTENTLPAIFPGILIHRIFDQFYTAFARVDRDTSKPWLPGIVQYVMPWIISVALALSILGSLMFKETSRVELVPGIYRHVNSSVRNSPFITLLVVAFSISFLCSLALSIRQARQASILYRAVSRHALNRDAALRIIRGERAESKLRHLTIVFTDIRDFTRTTDIFEPSSLLHWLNAYFERMDKPRLRYQGAIDKFMGDGAMLIFGLDNEKNNGAREAILCALSMLEELDQLNREFKGKSFPEMRVGIGIHTGPVIVGEVGSRNRVQDTAIGDTVNIASRIEQKTKSLSEDVLPIIVSRETLQASGLLRDPVHLDKGFLKLDLEIKGKTSQVSAFAVRDPKVIREVLNQLHEDPRQLADGEFA